jgi:hypothetical protein
MGSKRDLRCAIVHDGEIRRSDEEFGELMMRGTSATLWRDMMVSERLMRWPRTDSVGISVNGLIWSRTKYYPERWCSVG